MHHLILFLCTWLFLHNHRSSSSFPELQPRNTYLVSVTCWLPLLPTYQHSTTKRKCNSISSSSPASLASCFPSKSSLGAAATLAAAPITPVASAWSVPLPTLRDQLSENVIAAGYVLFLSPPTCIQRMYELTRGFASIATIRRTGSTHSRRTAALRRRIFSRKTR